MSAILTPAAEPKVCKTCNDSFPRSCFYTHKGSRDGLRGSCKSCHLAKHKIGHDPIKAKEAKVRYYKKNQQKCIDRAAEWRKDNREQYNEYSRVNRDSIRARGYALKRKYGITLEQYEELLVRQNNCCAICDRHESQFKTKLAVDHSHKTHKIRGLLCTACNYRLVAKHEDPSLLRKIASYIEQSTEWVVPIPPKKKRKRPSKLQKS